MWFVFTRTPMYSYEVRTLPCVSFPLAAAFQTHKNYVFNQGEGKYVVVLYSLLPFASGTGAR